MRCGKHFYQRQEFVQIFIYIQYCIMSLEEDNQEQKWLAIQIQKLQNQALKRARNLKKRPKSSLKKSHEAHVNNHSHQKISVVTPEKRYSIQKFHEKNQIEFVSQMLKSKELARKMCAKVKLQRLSFQHVIGCGVFGKVWRAEDRSTHKLYAVKQIAKSLVISKKGLATVMNERNMITQVHYHLIPHLVFSFQTQLHLYFVLPLMQKGDLRYHITKYKTFSEKEARFFVACIVSVLSYLRTHDIIHRDIKPENLLLDQSGYLHLSDFGIAIKASEVGRGKCCGTPAYMAPEVLFEKDYSFQADYYALGVLLYEMIIGERPYQTSNRQEIKTLMSKHSANIKKDQIPEGWSIQAADFANKLLHRNVNNRLGHNGMNELKNHPWLKNFPWDKLQRRELVSPYCQPFNHWQVDYKELFSGKLKEDEKNTQKSLLKGDLQELFHCFTYEGVQKSMQYTTKPSFQLKI